MTASWKPPWRPSRTVPVACPPPPEPWRSRGNATSTITPLPGVMPGQTLKNTANWRAFLYGMIPVATTALTAFNLQFHDKISVYLLLAVAVLGPLVSITNSIDKLRRIVYGVLGLLSTAGFAASLFVGHESYLPVVSAVVTILSSTLARYYTPTSTLISKT